MTWTYGEILALLLALPFVLTFFTSLIRISLFKNLGRPVPVDQEMLARGESALLGQGVRQSFARSMAPITRLLERLRIDPNRLTLLSLFLSLAAGVLVAFAQTALGGLIAFFGASLDYFDGRTARSTGRTTRAGGYLDSCLDRYSDIALLGGAAVLFRDSVPVLVACLVAMGAAVTISYSRAKAESLGAELKVGLMQRAERLVLYCLGAFLSPLVDRLLPVELRGEHLLFAVCLVVLAVLSAITSIHRTVAGFRELDGS